MLPETTTLNWRYEMQRYPLFKAQLIFTVILTTLHVFISLSKKKILLTYTPYLHFLFKFHLYFLISHCLLITLSLPFRESAHFTFETLQVLSFIITTIWGYCNLGGAILCATFLNSVQIGLGVRGLGRSWWSWVMIAGYTVWSNPCNVLDPTSIHIIRSDDELFTISPSNLLLIFLTSFLISYHVLSLRRSKIPPCFLESCRLVQLISVIAVFEIYLISLCAGAVLIGFRQSVICSCDSYYDYLIAFAHIFYILSAIFIDQWK